MNFNKTTNSLVGMADFANGRSFRIEQDTNISHSGCVVIDDETKTRYPASSIPKAWAKIRFMSGMTHKTENTTGWVG
jgi:hypothetical protein